MLRHWRIAVEPALSEIEPDRTPADTVPFWHQAIPDISNRPQCLPVQHAGCRFHPKRVTFYVPGSIWRKFTQGTSRWNGAIPAGTKIFLCSSEFQPLC